MRFHERYENRKFKMINVLVMHLTLFLNIGHIILFVFNLHPSKK